MRYLGTAIATAALGVTACGSVTDPSVSRPSTTRPAAPASPPVQSPPTPPRVFTPGPPAWSLQLTAFSVGLFRRTPGAVLQYGPERLELSETGGKSSAVLVEIHVDVPQGTRDADCTSAEMTRGETIGAGQSRDLAVTMGYCMPYATTDSEATEVSFTATFADDAGRIGQVRGIANVAGCTLGGGVGLISCRIVQPAPSRSEVVAKAELYPPAR